VLAARRDPACTARGARLRAETRFRAEKDRAAEAPLGARPLEAANFGARGLLRPGDVNCRRRSLCALPCSLTVDRPVPGRATDGLRETAATRANPTGRGCRIISVTDFTERHTARVLCDPVRLHRLVNSLRVVQALVTT